MFYYDYNKKPWELNTDLQEEILNKIANVIKSKTLACIAERCDKSKGDSDYSYGHTARAWRIKGIKDLSKEISELKIVEERGLYFEFKVGNTPMKFYSGSKDSMTDKMKENTPYEIQLDLKLQDCKNGKIYWRIMVNCAPNTHTLLAITFVGFNENKDFVCVYTPKDTYSGILYDITSPVKEAVKIPDAQFTRKKKEIKKAV
ncbi:hypothetical protein HDR60_00775 [bacterium]|nr:hypothetical protein [bacterium]